MSSKKITNIAIFEEIIVFVATLIMLYIKTYNVYNMSWITVLYPTFAMIAVNIGLVVLAFILLIIGAFNKKNYEEITEERE